jgi:hypothetical protein
MAYQFPTTDEFMTYFDRDFPFAGDGAPVTEMSKVREKDIEKAFDEAKINFNPSLFENEDEFKIAFLYLAAHYLVNDLITASQGVGSTFSWLTSSKSVGNVSESYAIPDKILNNPRFAFLTTTRYGAKYLSLIWPRLVGNIRIFRATTTP